MKHHLKERGKDMSSILIKNVSKTFETKDGSVQALNHVSLSIETGDIYGIIGMSRVQEKVPWYAV